MRGVKTIIEVARDVVIIAKEVKGNCTAGFKPGDKIVIRGANIIFEESDRVCATAFSNIYPIVYAVRVGFDLEKVGMGGRLWQCMDPGPPYTKGGTVLFEVKPL